MLVPGRKPARRDFCFGRGLLGAVVAVVIAIFLAVPATVDVGARPLTQFVVRVETGGHQRVASLHMTQSEGYASEFGYLLARLPCPTNLYRFLANEASLADSQSSSSEAGVHLLWDHLPHDVRCGSKLPPGSDRGFIKMTILSRSPIQGTGSPPIVYDGKNVKIESDSSCATLSGLCKGRYLLTVILEAFDRPLQFVYAFSVLSSTDEERVDSVDGGTAGGSGEQQCRVR
jgi:hypothetical protein